MFMHANFGHLFFNMFALFMFGAVLEQYWGAKRFVIYYFVCGLGAVAINMLVQYIRIKHAISELEVQPMYGTAAIQDVFSHGTDYIKDGYNYKDMLLAKLNIMLNTPTVGASGAVYGLLLAFAMLFPNAPLYLFFIPIPIKAKWLVMGFFVVELGLGILDSADDNVAHFAHLGGMIFGIFLILIWRRKQTF
jgi:membrane associated rhomboid family serine protease